jgi:hypothetical protein
VGCGAGASDDEPAFGGGGAFRDGGSSSPSGDGLGEPDAVARPLSCVARASMASATTSAMLDTTSSQVAPATVRDTWLPSPSTNSTRALAASPLTITATSKVRASTP